jgi:hypothetical protein
MYELHSTFSIITSGRVTGRPFLDTNDFGLPSGGLSINGIAFGWVPDDKLEAPMTILNEKIGGQPASTYVVYAQVTSTEKFDDSQITHQTRFHDILSSQAVLVASIMPYIPFGQFTPTLCDQIAASMRKFTDRGVFVWLRFGHEMNWYTRDGILTNTYTGIPSEFIDAWSMVSHAVHNNSMVKMFWSPNAGDDNVDQWWPGPASVDIVGLDIYPESQSKTFLDFVKPFHDQYALNNSIAFAIAETAVRGSDPDLKIWWLKEILDGQLMGKLPHYISCSWFEFRKLEEENTEVTDFTIALYDDKLLKQTKDILLQ